MDAARSREFFTGLGNIEREIIAKFRARGVPVTAANFKWNRGGGVLGPATEEAALEINVHGTLAKAVFSRDQVQDSHAGVNRVDVIALIEAMVEQTESLRWRGGAADVASVMWRSYRLSLAGHHWVQREDALSEPLAPDEQVREHRVVG